MFLKRLRGMLAQHDGKTYGHVMSYLRCQRSFAVLRATIMCVRRARSKKHRPTNALRPLAIDLSCDSARFIEFCCV